jgi:hypothetical protein
MLAQWTQIGGGHRSDRREIDDARGFNGARLRAQPLGGCIAAQRLACRMV